MPKTPDAFFAVAAVVRNLADMHDNMRANVQILQQAQTDGTLKVPLGQALQDLGKAFQQRLAMNDAVAAKGPPLQITPADLASVQAFLKTYADQLAAATDATPIAAVLTDVPAAVSPF
jgi:fructose-1-phosphate kinase PfkB-like protein